jgi:hypothetical protein
MRVDDRGFAADPGGLVGLHPGRLPAQGVAVSDRVILPAARKTNAEWREKFATK